MTMKSYNLQIVLCKSYILHVYENANMFSWTVQRTFWLTLLCNVSRKNKAVWLCNCYSIFYPHQCFLITVKYMYSPVTSAVISKLHRTLKAFISWFFPDKLLFFWMFCFSILNHHFVSEWERHFKYIAATRFYLWWLLYFTSTCTHNFVFLQFGVIVSYKLYLVAQEVDFEISLPFRIHLRNCQRTSGHKSEFACHALIWLHCTIYRCKNVQ